MARGATPIGLGARDTLRREAGLPWNYQASPDEEGFSASGSLRMGVCGMSRFGMGKEDSCALALLIHEVVMNKANVTDQVKALREGFSELQFCFRGTEYADVMEQLHELL